LDNVGDNIDAANASWTFSGDVVKTFDSHIKKSVPMYDESHILGSHISDHFISIGGNIVDIGSSTGTFLKKVADRHSKDDLKFIGYEIENDMVNKSKANTNKDKRVKILCEDIISAAIPKSCFISSFYTLQFISQSNRQSLVDKIYSSLNWGGGFLLFEKVRAPDARFQDLTTSLYTEFKLSNGFSEKEIVGKTRSLKGILEPFSSQGNIDMLKRAGFLDIMTVMKHINFEGFLCIK